MILFALHLVKFSYSINETNIKAMIPTIPLFVDPPFSAPTITSSASKTEQIETHLPDFGGTWSQNRTDRFIPESRIEKNEDKVFATTQTAAAAHFAANSGVVP